MFPLYGLIISLILGIANNNMKTFKQYLIENNLTQVASSAIASAALAAPPKPEARAYIVDAMKKKESFRPVAVKDTIATGQPIVYGYGTTNINPKTGKKKIGRAHV